MNFHRYYFPDQIVFLTQIVEGRKPVFADADMVILLRETLHNAKQHHPFTMLAYVILPDHFHLLIQPTGDENFSKIMSSLKFNFTLKYKQKLNIDVLTKFWQKRFWDHVIRDEIDLENHVHYIHFNPIKHGYVNDPFAWNDSSISEWQKKGAYPDDLVWKEPSGSVWGE